MKNRLSASFDDPRRSGLTLIELLIALTFVVVVALLLRVVVNALLTQLETRLDQARLTKARMEIRLFADALERYVIDTGDYPTTEQGLSALFQGSASRNQWRTRNLKGRLKNDPWGRPYVYVYPGSYALLGVPYDLASYGKDGKPGGDGANADITIWDLTAADAS